MDWIEVRAAYGKTYANQKAVQADWDADKDFRIAGGPYINKTDATRAGLRVIVRYGVGSANGGGKVYSVK
jgi:hypothetical protein